MREIIISEGIYFKKILETGAPDPYPVKLYNRDNATDKGFSVQKLTKEQALIVARSILNDE